MFLAAIQAGLGPAAWKYTTRVNQVSENKTYSFRKLAKSSRFDQQRRVKVARDVRHLLPPPPTFVDRRTAVAADNLSARRQCHCCWVFILLQFSMTKEKKEKRSSENFGDGAKFSRKSLKKHFLAANAASAAAKFSTSAHGSR